MPEFRTPYTERVRETVDCTLEERRTRDAFQEECDINVIVQRWLKTGVDPRDPGQQQFGDFTFVPSYQEAFDQVIRAGRAFHKLPIDIRKYFNHDADELLRFIDDPANHDQAVEMGLLPPQTPVEEPAAEPAPETPTAPPEGGEEL